MIIVEATSPTAPQARTLLEASHTLMASLYPTEANHNFDLSSLQAENIHFFAARMDTEIVTTGALAAHPGYGEVKSMFTAPSARGKGAAAALLHQIEVTARNLRLPLLRLETGTGLDDAHRLYAHYGFAERGPFGDYPDSRYSLFMEKPLD